ncbi:uncharacterized protein LOC113776096 isoform X2 [Coffea eugenioides]|uniref:Phosphoglycerate kinase n=1 Tax=Coffea arabica TaxID=13443 RepID=A0ABM4UTE8_COFAR|nr:uncharacterized protein LOC113776096 isoform X2 [Coffea eugenioides]
MNQALDIFRSSGYCFSRNPVFLNSSRNSPAFLLHKQNFPQEHLAAPLFEKYRRLVCSKRVNSKPFIPTESNSLCVEAETCDGADFSAVPHVQTLREFPKEELSEKVVMVRFDSKLLFQQLQERKIQCENAVSTIKYLHEAGAKVILISSWDADDENTMKIVRAESIAGALSSVLQVKVVPVKLVTTHIHSAKQESNIILLENLFQFKEEPANCKGFARLLSSGVDIFVNDAFSQSHRVLASTVAISRFCYASIAGFHFEAVLSQLKNITKTSQKPYVAIIGGGNLVEKAAALRLLVSICDGLVFVGNIAFQIMHALGLPLPMKLVEHGATEEALTLINSMKSRSRAVIVPKDFLCLNNLNPEKLEIFSADCLVDGWQPVDLGPESLEEIASLVSKCKKILWIGPVRFGLSHSDAGEASRLGAVVDRLRSQNNLETILVGKVACTTVLGSNLNYSVIENASVVWEFLKGRSLPGLMALDRSYPFDIKWDGVYDDPTRPLVVDVGSGNGLFLFGMAKKTKDLNFLGLEINGKLVNRCLERVLQTGMKNGYFIRTNATSTFRSIISSYPGELVLVSIQCPNPDFNKPEHRWEMVQRSLIEAIADLLALDGKVFLQSDIEGVAIRMKSEFVKYGKGKIMVMDESEDASCYQRQWLNENPFGVRSDWEQHVLDRGANMYRLLLSKPAIIAGSTCRG